MPCVQQGATYGRLEVSAWGANTMRAEFAVLTGIPEEQLGYDRFNPYHAFWPARRSLRWLRGCGMRAIAHFACIRSTGGFFAAIWRCRRWASTSFSAARPSADRGGRPTDPIPTSPGRSCSVLDAEGPRTFIFAITMGNHGPWSEDRARSTRCWTEPLDAGEVPQGRALLRYFAGLSQSDEMLAILLEELGPGARDALFGFYGDHQPSLPDAFEYFGFDDWASDYVLVGGAPSRPRRLDLPAHMLPQMIIRGLRDRDMFQRTRTEPLGVA